MRPALRAGSLTLGLAGEVDVLLGWDQGGPGAVPGHSYVA